MEKNNLRALANVIYIVSDMEKSKYDSIQNIEDILEIIYAGKEPSNNVLKAAEQSYQKKFHKMVMEG